MADADAVSRLRDALAADPPKRLTDQLPDAEVVALADAVRAARRAQAEALRASADRAFDHIPRLLRGPIRKALGA